MSMKARLLARSALGAAVLAAAPAQHASAQDDARVVTGIEEIVVTARRVAESSQTVPIAITAFSPEALERRDITRINDIDTAVPNLIFDMNTGTTNAARIFLRGLGEDESFFTADMPVGIYVDDVYIPRSNGAIFELFDIARMEVLRGPQGTLFGRNTTAGAIQVISRKPDDELTGSAELSIGSYDRREAKASIGGPIVPGKVAGQVAALYKDQEGWLKDLTTGDRLNGLDILAGRATVRFTPTDSIDALFTVDGTRDHSDPSSATAMLLPTARSAANPVGVGEPTLFGLRQFPRLTLLGGEDVTETRTSGLTDSSNDTDSWGVSAQVSYMLGDVELKSITAHRQMDWDLWIDFDGSALNIFNLLQLQEQENTSQEFRISAPVNDRFSLIGGFFYFNEGNEQITRTGASIAGVPILSPELNPASGIAPDYSFATLETDSYAVFLSGTFDVTDDIRLTAGGRYTWEEKDYFADARAPNGTVRTLAAPSPLLPGVPVGTLAQNRLIGKVKEFNPSASVDWQATEDALVYASVRNGFKGASFNGRLTTPVAVLSATPLRPENVWAYEVGAKTQWLDNRLRINAALFRTDVEDWQRAAFVNNNFQRGNQGDIRIDGLELEMTAVLADGLEVNSFLGVLDAGYEEIKFNIPATCNGINYAPGEMGLVSAPEVTLGIGGNYSFSVPGVAGLVTLSGNGSYKSESQTATCPHDALKQEAHWMVDANLAYETEDERFRVFVGVKNIFDEQVNMGSSAFVLPFPLPSFTAIYYNPPRMWNAGIRVRF